MPVLFRKFFKNKFLYKCFYLIALLITLATSFSFGQCTNCGSNYPTGTFTTTSNAWTTISTNIWGSEYHYATLNTGYIYQWKATATSETYDTQLTLYPSATCTGSISYNDDYTPPGDNQSLMAYQPGTTAVRILLSQWSCTSNSTSTTIQWRRIPTTPTISASATSICSGTSVTLTASNLAANDDFIDIQWGTTSGGTQVSADAYSVTVSPGATTTYYLRYYVKGGNPSGSGIYTGVASVTITVSTPPTAPTGISVTGGGSSICLGELRTLTASGGSTGSGCTYQWYAGGCGSGSVLGTGISLSNISPVTTTTYYVRRVGNSPCSNTTGCASITITVNSASTAPTSIVTTIIP